MWDWERASVPYRPIYRRRLLRRRFLTVLLAVAIAIPFYLYYHHQSTQSIGARVFDEVTSTVAVRYFDASYHGVAWQAVAERYRPLVVNAPTTAARYAALRSMLAQLHDSHTAVYSPTDLEPLRDRHPHAVFGMAPDATVSEPAVDWKTLRPGIGYLRLSSFPDSVHSVLGWAMASVGHEGALILDLRRNPGGLVDSVDEVAGIFLPPGTLISTGTRRYNLFGSQRFTATDNAGFTYPGRLVVLIDKNSRSGAESLARALQYYHRATLIGTHTAGKVLGVDAEMTLADGGLLRVATLDMHAPDGQRLEGRGVTPDVFDGAADTQLDAAVALIDAESADSPCPVKISAFRYDAVGLVHGYGQFEFDLQAKTRGTRLVRLRPDGESTGALSVVIPAFDGSHQHYVFPWPVRSLSSIRLLDAKDIDTGLVTHCDQTDPYPIKKDSVPGGSLPSGSNTFEDSAVVFNDQVVALWLQDAQFVDKAQPSYPFMAKEQGVEGTAIVAVSVGPGGQLVDAKIYKSSGSELLDAEAVSSAQRSTFSQPTIDGKPVTRRYVIQYTWRLL